MTKEVFYYNGIGIKFKGARYELGIPHYVLLIIFRKLKKENLLEDFLEKYKKAMEPRVKLLYKLISPEMALKFAEYLTQEMGWWIVIKRKKTRENVYSYFLRTPSLGREYIEFLFLILKSIFNGLFKDKILKFGIVDEKDNIWRVDVSVEKC